MIAIERHADGELQAYVVLLACIAAQKRIHVARAVIAVALAVFKIEKGQVRLLPKRICLERHIDQFTVSGHELQFRNIKSKIRELNGVCGIAASEFLAIEYGAKRYA